MLTSYKRVLNTYECKLTQLIAEAEGTYDDLSIAKLASLVVLYFAWNMHHIHLVAFIELGNEQIWCFAWAYLRNDCFYCFLYIVNANWKYFLATFEIL